MFQRLGFGEIALIILAVLLIFGPAKLPQLGKSIGEGLREFKKSVKSISEEATTEANRREPEDTEKKV